MGKIKKILENELIGGTQSTDVYPVTSTQAVYDENNRRLSDFVFDKDNVVQETGTSETKVMSQKSATETFLAKEKIVNDLTTGGADKALSAEMGKTLFNTINNIKPVIINGNVTNAADEEDITSEDNLLKFKDRTHVAGTNSGMGYVILRKNKTFAEQVIKANTIYEVRYDFNLCSETIEIPENCTLKFNGGSVKNGTLVANNCEVSGSGILCATKGFFLNSDRSVAALNDIVRTEFTVSTQNEFDTALTKAINGNPVTIYLNKGHYYIDSYKNLQADVNIIGQEGAIISSLPTRYSMNNAIEVSDSYYKCNLEDTIPDFSLFIHDDNIVNVSESYDIDGVNKSDKIIIGIDGNNFKLPITPNLMRFANKDSFEGVYGWLDSLWVTCKFKVLSSDAEYFHCVLTYSGGTTNLNGDIENYGLTLNYVLYNIEDKDIYYDNTYIYIPTKYSYVDVVANLDSHTIGVQRSITVKGVEFRNFTTLFASYGNTQKSTIFEDCKFSNITGGAIVANNIDDASIIRIVDCVFDNCCISRSGAAVSIQGTTYEGYRGAEIKNCTFKHHGGWGMYKTTASGLNIDCSTHVDNCIFENWNRGGLHISHGDNLITNCKVYNTDEYNLHRDRNYSLDFGGIYCNHLFSDDESIRNNTLHKIWIDRCYIYNMLGRSVSRGIFIDDARGDVTCTNNVIFKCDSYSIDSRNDTNVGGNSITLSSIRNRIEGNLCLTPYRLAYGHGVLEEEKYPAKNILPIELKDTNNIQNTEILDTYLDVGVLKQDGERVTCDASARETLQKLPNIGFVKSFGNYYITKSLFLNEPTVGGGIEAFKIDIDFSKITDDYTDTIKICFSTFCTISIDIVSLSSNEGFRDRVVASSSGFMLTVFRHIVNGRKLTLYIMPLTIKGHPKELYGTYKYNKFLSINISLIDITEFKHPTIGSSLLGHTIVDNNISFRASDIQNSKIREAMSGIYMSFDNALFFDGNSAYYKLTKWGLFRTIGDTASRPVLGGFWSLLEGFQYYDTDLDKPIYWKPNSNNTNGTWVDATGVEV